MSHSVLLPAIAAIACLSACRTVSSHVSSTNLLDGKVVDYSYQTYTMSHRVEDDSFQAYVQRNDLVAYDPSERLLPKELQGLFYLDGAPFPDKTLSLKHVQPLDAKAQRIRWMVPHKTTFAWLNTPKGHKAFAKAKSHGMYYELEWRDCTDEVMSDMAKQFAAYNIQETPKRCTAAERRFAVINAFAFYDGERFGIPESILYFDMYLIPKSRDRDYVIWHRRSKICADNATGAVGAFCDALRSAGLRPSKGDGYSRYNFTQVLTPEGKRTTKYNDALLPDVIKSAGSRDNIFLVCDSSEGASADACIDGTEQLPPIQDRDIRVVDADDKDRSFFEQISRARKFMGYVIKATLDLVEVIGDAGT